MSDDSDIDVNQPRKRKRKTGRISDCSSSGEGLSPSARSRIHRARHYNIESSSESDSSIEIARTARVGRVMSSEESTSDSSDSDSSLELGRARRVGSVRIPSDRSDSEDWSTESESSNGAAAPPSRRSTGVTATATATTTASGKCTKASSCVGRCCNAGGSSSDSDGNTDKCPICLASFRTQEVGSPEACDHSFCAECIQEWAKNMNTCPVDRQPFNAILVRNHLNGKVLRLIPVEPPTAAGGAPGNDITPPLAAADATYCEVCGAADREDRMLLCDGCDLGYHLECLQPPLAEVPYDAWYCSTCSRPTATMATTAAATQTVDIAAVGAGLSAYDISVFVEFGEGTNQGRTSTRLVPRTQQSERVRTRIMTLRQQQQSTTAGPSNSSITTTTTTTTARATTTRTKKKSKKRKRRTSRKLQIKYEIDEATGQKIKIQASYRVRKHRRRTRRKVRVAKPKTVKKRLAVQLGMCTSRNNVSQALPDIKVSHSANSIGMQRTQAGIPTLHLFGQRDVLDYFSGSDSEPEDAGFGNTLVRRRPNHSDAAIMRRAARRKAITLPRSVNTTSTSDLLGSILESQSQFHARNTVLSLNQDGSLKVDKTASKYDANSNNRVNVNDNRNHRVRQTPLYSNHAALTSTSPTGSSSSGAAYRQLPPHSTSSGNMNAVSTSSNAAGGGNSSSSTGGNEQDAPQDYSLHPSCSTADTEDSEKKDNNSDSELDIYSDIETVSTSRATDGTDKPETTESPVPVLTQASSGQVLSSHNGTDDDDVNSDDADLIIDTEKVEESTAVVTSSVDSAGNVSSSVTASASASSTSVRNVVVEESTPHSTCDVQSHQVQSTANNDEEDLDSEDDGCPNFNIYSAESMDVAKSSENKVREEQNAIDEAKLQQQAFPSSQEEEEQLMLLDGHEDDMDDNDKAEKDGDEDELPVASNDLDDITSHDGDDRNNDSDEKNTTEVTTPKKATPPKTTKPSSGGLYSDSDDEMVKIDTQPFGLADIRNMTEDISEEERSYTPCLDEKLPTTSSSSFKERLEDDLEAISDEERNDFDESHEQKAASDGGDALEINAKESELDFTKPEDYEEGEIVDKSKKAEAEVSKISSNDEEEEDEEGSTSPKVQNESNETVPEVEKTPEKVETTVEKEEVSTTEKESFKKLSKSNKERNYRDKDKKEKDKDRHHHHHRDDDDDDDRRGKNDRERDRDKENRRERKREKRKEIPRYNVRTLIADKPQVRKDRFGRDEERRRAHSRSRSSGGGSVSPPPQKRSSVSPRGGGGGARRSYTPDKNNKKRRNKRSSRSKSYERKRSRTPNTRGRNKRDSSPPARAGTAAKRSRRSRSRGGGGGGKPRNRSLTPPTRHHRDWEQASAVPPRRRSSRAGWTPSISRSRSPPQERRLTPSWTPPRSQQAPPVTVATTTTAVAAVAVASVPVEEAVQQAPLANKPESLTVILMNDAGKKKKEKRKRAEKKKEEQRNATAARKRRRERGTPPPSKEVFASGDNILVSVSFNKETEGTSKRKRDDEVTTKRTRKEKEKHTSTAASKTAIVQTPAIVATSSIIKPRRKRKPQQDLSGVKPVAIIDLDRSPFKELTPSPKDVIVLSDSENGAESGGEQLQPDDGDVGNGDGAVVASILACDSSSQQVVSPARSSGGDSTYTIGGPKTPPEPQVKFSLSTKPQLRGMNPLHEDDDEEEEEDNELLANTTVAEGGVGGTMVPHNGSGTMAPAEDIDPQEELEQRLNESLQLQQQQLLQLQQHKGPNTPPDPPNSAPSSPDAYDPFDPTKSRSPTPEPVSKSVGGLPSPTKTVSQDDGKDSSGISGKGDDSSDLRKSHTPPVVADIQPADSQSNTSITNLTPSHSNPNPTTSSTPNIPPSSSLLNTKPLPPTSSSAAITTVLNQIAAIAGNFPTTSVSSAKTIPSTSSSSSSATIITSTPSVASATSIMATTSAVAAVASSLARINVLGGALLNPVGGGVALGSGMVKKKVVGKGVGTKGGRKVVGGGGLQGGGGNGGNDTNVEFEPSPYSPGSSDYEDLFEPPAEQLGGGSGSVAPKTSKKKASNAATQGNKSGGGGNTGCTFDNLFGSLSPLTKSKQKSGGKFNRKSTNSGKGTKLVGVKIDEDSLKVMDEVPNSAVEMQVKDKFLKKLNRQERVVEEVKLVLKPHYNKKHITKEEYKDVLRRAVPKICHNKSGEINPKKIQNLIEAYVKKLRQSKKVTSSSSKM